MTSAVPPADSADADHPVEESLEDLYEHAPCGYLTTKLDGAVVRVNSTFLSWAGHAQADVVGRSFVDLLSVGSQLVYETRCLPVLRLKGELREAALMLRRADGSPLSILVNLRLHSVTAGQPQLIRIAVFDSTGRQDYERDLLAARRAAERSEVRVRVLQQASSVFGAAQTVEAITTALADTARASFDATAATVLLADNDSSTVRGVLSGPRAEPLSLDGLGPHTEAMRLGRVVSVSSVDEAERTFPAMAQPMHCARIEALTAIPVLDNDTAIGVLVCSFGRRREFDDDEVELQCALARQAAQALKRVQLQEELSHQALHDQLTGLANRNLLEARLVEVLAGAKGGSAMALIFLDLDGFKVVNDNLGHAVGDVVLKQVADRLRANSRRTDTIVRFGGDEFVIVCADTNIEQAATTAERIRLAIRLPLGGVPSEYAITASIGVAQYTGSAGRATPDPDALVLRADAAMYESKEAGKDRHTLVVV